MVQPTRSPRREDHIRDLDRALVTRLADLYDDAWCILVGERRSPTKDDAPRFAHDARMRWNA
jgi:hypothetical protein